MLGRKSTFRARAGTDLIRPITRSLAVSMSRLLSRASRRRLLRSPAPGMGQRTPSAEWKRQCRWCHSKAQRGQNAFGYLANGVTLFITIAVNSSYRAARNHCARLYSLRFFISRPRRTLIALMSWPERQAKPNQKHGAQQQKKRELLKPGDRGDGDSHRDTQKADLE